MEVLNLLVGRDDGIVRAYYGIEYESKLWLVTAWLVDKSTQLATPERMIRVDSYQPSEPPFHYANIRLPKDVIDGLSQDTPGYEVRSLPSKPVVHRRDLKMLPKIF